MAQAVLDRRGRRRDWRSPKWVLPWVILGLLATFMLVAAIGLAKSLGVVGRWLSSMGPGEPSPSPTPAEPIAPAPAPVSPEAVPPTPPPRVQIASPTIARRQPEEWSFGGAATREEITQPEPPAQAPQVVVPPPSEPELVSCGSVTCGPGLVCCNPSCGTCVAPGEPCSNERRCDRAVAPVSQACGVNTCNVGQVCCNPSCGTCVAIDEACDPKPCTPVITYPTSQACGMNTCNAGEVCCNPSCGTCVEPGEPCSREPCK